MPWPSFPEPAAGQDAAQNQQRPSAGFGNGRVRLGIYQCLEALVPPPFPSQWPGTSVRRSGFETRIFNYAADIPQNFPTNS
jgi:hypothetical protein